MPNKIKVLAYDFGASSGRTILGKFDGRKVTLEELHRFSNDPVYVKDALYWDTLRLFYEIKQGLLKAKHSGNRNISSLGIDTWGVDFGLLDAEGQLIGNAYHYRDSRTDGIVEQAFKLVDKDEMFRITGIQFMQINTIFQLYSMVLKNSPSLKYAKTLLFTPDLFNYLLTGIKSTEYTIASTSQMLDANKKIWAKDMLKNLNIPTDILTDIVKPGTNIGTIQKSVADELDIDQTPVISVASHDTGSAVVSVPAQEDDYIYLSSGTWSLMGIESSQPIINDNALKYNFTNEGGFNDKIRFLKNITGLWIIQECRRAWIKAGENIGFGEMGELAAKATPFKCFIDTEHPTFATPGDMPQKIQDFCSKTGQYIPQSKGEIVRCVLESLAFRYKWVVNKLEEINHKQFPVLHIIGGGVQDKLLCQFTANATKKHVITGPIEATAIGNILVQLMTLGEVSNLSQAREIVRSSFPTKEYSPVDQDSWDEAYNEYLNIVK